MWKCKEWWNNQLTLGIWCRILIHARHQPHLLIPSAQTISHEKTKNSEIRSNFQQIVLYCIGLCTQYPGLREVDLEPSPKRGSDKISMLEQGRNTEEKATRIRTAWTHIWMIPALREIDLDPNAKRQTNRTRVLVSLFWSSWSLHLKQSPNLISHKSTKVDPIRSSPT